MLSKVTRFADPFHAIERRDRRAIARQWIDVVCLAIGPTPRAARLTAPARRRARRGCVAMMSRSYHLVGRRTSGPRLLSAVTKQCAHNRRRLTVG